MVQFIGRKPVVEGCQFRRFPIEGDVVLRLDDSPVIEVGTIWNPQRPEGRYECTGIGGHLYFYLVGALQAPGLVVDQDPIPTGGILIPFDPQPAQIRIKNQTFWTQLHFETHSYILPSPGASLPRYNLGSSGNCVLDIRI